MPPRPSPDCCAQTVALVIAERTSASCPTCSTTYHPHGPTVEARESAVHPAASRVANDTRPSRPSLHVFDDPDLVAARELITALRPDPSGPFGWGASEKAPVLEPLRVPVLVQCSLAAAVAPRGAFAPRSSALPSADVHARIDQLHASDPRAGMACAWLQRYGTLVDGLGAMLVALAREVAPADVQDRWAKVPASHQREARRMFGVRELRHAHAVWFGRS